MRIVFDTNVILSALLTDGLSARVMDIGIDKHQLFISSWIIDEVTRKLKDKFKVPSKDLSLVLEFIHNVFEIIEPRGTLPEVCGDKDDNNILHLAENVNADIIITGDKDLLRLKVYKYTEIINPREFMVKYSE